MSVWLHDVGKLVIPLEVMDKESRLGSGLSEVMHRFETIELRTRIAYLEGKISQTEYDSMLRDTSEARELITSVNRAGFLPDDTLARIDALAAKTYHGADGEELPYITADEHTSLRVRKGTLTDAERSVMESHVSMTERMLKEMTFSRDYLKVPEWASMHHEFINGRGYPKKLSGALLPREVRLLTILDIFDALTARDRPYKPPMPTEKAFAILDSMVSDGQLDGDILEMFKASGAWNT